LIDKSLSKELGLTGLLESIKYGEMRYGENIFDQKSSMIQDSILHSDINDSQKAHFLGLHVLSELRTHNHNQDKFAAATGGKTKPKYNSKPKQSRFFTPESRQADYIQAKSLYNTWAKSKGLPELPAGSSFNDTSAAAFANFNADPSNLRKINVQSSPYLDPTTGNSRQMALSIGLGEFMPELKLNTLDSIVGYNRKGEAVYDDQVLPTAYDKASNRLLVPNDDYFPTATDSDVKPQATSTTTQVNGRDARDRAFRNQNLVSTLTSAAQTGIGAILASEEIPRYQPTANYTQMVDDAVANRNKGLTAEELAFANQSANQNYANSIEAIRQIGGGGASGASVLGALQSASSNRDRASLNTLLADIDARRQNEAVYRNVVNNDQRLDQTLFNQDLQNAQETRANGLALAAQGVQNIYDQSLYNQAYGRGSLYNQNIESSIARTNEYADLQKLQTQLALEQLRKNPGVSSYGATTPARDIRTLPTINIPR
jgi:hypothetical protein